MLRSFATGSDDLASLQPDLARVHALLWQLGDADGALLQDLVRSILDRPRDAYRAAAALLLARAVRPETPDAIIQFAAAVQIVYAASLAHRTILAGAVPSQDERLVVLTGDYLYAQAAAITAELMDLQVMAQLAASIQAICREGTHPDALPATSGQSAGLFRLSLWGAAELLRLSPDLQAAVAQVGQALDAGVQGHPAAGEALRAATTLLATMPSFASLAGAQVFLSGVRNLAPPEEAPAQGRCV
jgi:geranylgeranyl pyrophosphate synthase